MGTCGTSVLLRHGLTSIYSSLAKSKPTWPSPEELAFKAKVYFCRTKIHGTITQSLWMELGSWYVEPSQPQRIKSGLKTNFKLFPSHSAHQSSSHKFSKIYKISPDTNSHETKHTHTNTKHGIFKELVPSVLPLLKKFIGLGQAGIANWKCLHIFCILWQTSVFTRCLL